MKIQDESNPLITAVFPIRNHPPEVLLKPPIQGEIDGWIKLIFEGNTWQDVNTNDIADMQYSVSALQGYFHPNAYAYYLPTILMGVENDIIPIVYGAQWLLPGNSKWERRSGWWFQFESVLTPDQRRFLRDWADGHLLLLDQYDEAEPIVSAVQAMWA